MKKHITHITKSYFPIPGGIENVTQLFCEGVAREGKNVKVISFSERDAKQAISTDSVNGVEVIRIRPFMILYSQPLSLRYLIEGFRCFLYSKKVIVHWPNLLAFLSIFLATSFIPKSKQASLLIYWHGDAVRQRSIKFLFEPLVKIIIKKANQIIVPSTHYIEISDFRKTLSKKPLLELPLTVTDQFETLLIQSGGPMILPYLGDVFKISAFGRFVWLKGFQDLIEAADISASNVEVYVMGSEDVYLEAIRKKIISMKNPKRIKLLVNIPLVNAIKHIRESHLFVMPSRQEMAGLVQMEAMLCGKAVITTDVPRSAVNFFNKNEVTGLVAPVGNPKALAQKIDFLVNNPELLQRLSINALEKAQKEFSTEKYRVALQAYLRS